MTPSALLPVAPKGPPRSLAESCEIFVRGRRRQAVFRGVPPDPLWRHRAVPAGPA